MNTTRQESTYITTADITEHEVFCAECGSQMHLRTSRHGLFYGCRRFPRCKGTHGAHPNGAPLGIPADGETKRWRIKAHEQFDKLWKGADAVMSRPEAYQWLRDTLQLSEEEGHIGRFSVVMCERLIAVLEARAQFDAFNPTVDTLEIQRRRAEKKKRRKQKRRSQYRGFE